MPKQREDTYCKIKGLVLCFYGIYILSKEKHAAMTKPVLAVFAASDARRRYYTDIADAAGFHVSSEQGAALFFLADAGMKQAEKDQQGICIADGAPIRAGRLIAQLMRLRARSANAPEKVAFGTYTLDVVQSLWVDQKQETEIRLTEKEVDVLLYLHAHPEGVSRQDLLENIWGYVEGVETHTIETHIYRLRQKIEADPANPSILLTKENGYVLGR